MLRENVSPSQPSAVLQSRIPELDGLRGIAIILVLLMHYVAATIVVSRSSWLWYAVFAPLHLAYTGVDLFFVLSGFLIGGILLDVRGSPNFYKTFYARRVYRIFPVYFLWFAVFFVLSSVGAVVGKPYMQLVMRPTLPLWSYVLFVQNVAAAHSRTFGPFWLAATWSLAVEEQFYLLLPGIVRNVTGKMLLVIVAAGILAAPVSRAFFGGNPFAQGLLTTSHLDDLGFGVLAAIALRHAPFRQWFFDHRTYALGAIALATIIAAGAAWESYMLHSPFWTTMLGTAFAVLFVLVLAFAVVCPGVVFGSILRSRFLQESGKLSYAMYIFHQGLLFFVFALLFHQTPVITNLQTFGVVAACLGITVALAALSWRFIEEPLLSAGRSRNRY